MIKGFMQANGFKLSHIRGVSFVLTLFLVSCGVADTKVVQSKDKLKSLEAAQSLIKSTITIGQRNFDTTFAGNFNDPVCLSIKNTLNAIPINVDIIAQIGRENSFKAFRQDILIDALRNTDLPFIQWETVPAEERNRAIFSAERAEVGYLKALGTQRALGDLQEFHIFDEPHAREGEEYITYKQWSATWPDIHGQKDWPIRKYRLNEIYTLYDIKPKPSIQKFSEEQLLDWEDGIQPYFSSDYHIIGPDMTMRYPFKNGEAEFSIGGKPIIGYPSRIDDMNYDISELIWDGEFLTAISFDDDSLFSRVRQKFSIKVTRSNSADFLTKSFFENLSKPTSRKHIEAQDRAFSEPKSVNVCDITLLLKTTVEE